MCVRLTSTLVEHIGTEQIRIVAIGHIQMVARCGQCGWGNAQRGAQIETDSETTAATGTRLG